MRHSGLALVRGLVLAFASPGVSLAATAVPSYVTAAVNDPARAADAANDARRKITALMVFSEVRPGEKVAELIPGTGYFSRVFSDIIGPKGQLYAIWPQAYDKVEGGGAARMQQWAGKGQYANISVLLQPGQAFSVPQPVDLVFTSQNYHDYPDAFMGKLDPVALDRQVYAALKPGGLFVVIDHVAPAGSGMSDTDTLHRIDPATVRQQVESVGFIFDGQSAVLHNPADTHTLKVFDKRIRGRTDQFAYRFRKPLH